MTEDDNDTLKTTRAAFLAAVLLSGAMFSCSGAEEGAEIIEAEPAQTAEPVSGVGAETEDA